MHNHNSSDNKNGGHKGMLWMMIPCLLLLGVLFLDGGKLSGGGYLWPILVGVFVIAHIWMMFRGHRKHGDTNSDEKHEINGEESKDNKNNKNHSGHGCCH
ncbi:hypothetical protein A2814_02590 [Candidatus Nomurabacteria bacterium RIFCSPHIGHO2_01_FULL_38_19]|uniref:Uncharacterized protein n=1 Tax=Candidatus Nomurabacteria bacterium RIFCSPHIGHO2_01_FULL_38_19 TaxID=1801732 RepID=A0A1F6UU87_9BACT|nr:MAG: hypothetical protein A2814_02590 [Candidatus Nomurabacteria bacterium RIFCSPHIGHO2_01_FULL_38_19]